MSELYPNGKRLTTPMSVGIDPDTPLQLAQNEYTIPLKDLFEVVWRRLWIVLLVAIVFTGVAIGLSLSQEPTYTASMKLLVQQQREGSGLDTAAGDVAGLQQFTRTVATLVNTRPVAEAVIQRLDLSDSPEDILGGMKAEQIAETQAIEVTYEDSDPERARQIANTSGEMFSEQVSGPTPDTNAITAKVWEEAGPPSRTGPNPVRSGVLALGFGCMAGIGLAFLLAFLDSRLRSPEEAEQASGLPTLSAIPEFRARKLTYSRKTYSRKSKEG